MNILVESNECVSGMRDALWFESKVWLTGSNEKAVGRASGMQEGQIGSE